MKQQSKVIFIFSGEKINLGLDALKVKIIRLIISKKIKELRFNIHKVKNYLIS